MGFDIGYQGVLISLLTIVAFFVGHFMESGVWAATDSPDGMTMAFLTMSMAEIFHSFNMRSQRGSLLGMRKQNLVLCIAGAASLVATTAVIEIPFLANAFGFTPISFAEYAVAIGLAFLVLPIVELVKCVQRAIERARNKA